MTGFEKFAKALALTESNDNAQAWGDQGLACGRWQMHPAWVDEWWPDGIEVNWSWDHLFRAALLRFYTAKFQPGIVLSKIIMEFHLGAAAVASGEFDHAYARKFALNYAAIADLPS